MEINEQIKQAQVAIVRSLFTNPVLRHSYKSERRFPMKVSNHVPCTSKDDTSKCHITVMTALSDGQVVVYDEANHKLKAFSEKGIEIISFQEEIYNCFDITATDQNTFAITQTHKNVISFFSVERASIKPKSRKLSLPGIGFHCKYSRQHYCAVCDLTDPESRSVIIIDNERKARGCLKIPHIAVSHIAMHPKRDEVFISDKTNKMISCFYFERNNLHITPFKRLNWSPSDITVVASKYLFVCNADTKRVLKLRLRVGRGEGEDEELSEVECAGLVSTHPKRDVLFVTNLPKGEDDAVNNVTAFKINVKKIHYEDFKYEL